MIAITGLLACAIPLQAAAVKPDAKQAEVLRAVAGLFAENRAKFESGTIDFDYQDGYANSFDDARRGRLREVYVADGSYSYKGQDAVFKKVFPTEAMATTTVWVAENQGSSRLDSSRALTNGKVTLTERITVARNGHDTVLGHIINPGTADFYRFVV